MLFSEDFLALNFAFARRVTDLTGMEIIQSLLEHTYCYLVLGLRRDFDPQHPIWRGFLEAFNPQETSTSRAYDFYRANHLPKPLPPPEQSCGCFYYSNWGNGRFRLHFRNAEEGSLGPLSQQRIQLRQRELMEIIQRISREVNGIKTLVGGSWLYHLRVYRQLFPHAYLQTAIPSLDFQETRYLALWGQFINRMGAVRQDLAREFLERLQQASCLEECMRAFPYCVLHLEAPLDVFDVE